MTDGENGQQGDAAEGRGQHEYVAYANGVDGGC